MTKILTAELRQATQKRVCKVKDKTAEVHTLPSTLCVPRVDVLKGEKNAGSIWTLPSFRFLF